MTNPSREGERRAERNALRFSLPTPLPGPLENFAWQGSGVEKAGGAEEIRTPDPHNAIVVLYQLSYDPSRCKGRESIS